MVHDKYFILSIFFTYFSVTQIANCRQIDPSNRPTFEQLMDFFREKQDEIGRVTVE